MFVDKAAPNTGKYVVLCNMMEEKRKKFVPASTISEMHKAFQIDNL